MRKRFNALSVAEPLKCPLHENEGVRGKVRENKEKMEEWYLPPIIEAHCPSCNALLMFPSSAREVLCPKCQKHLTVCCEIIVSLNKEKDRRVEATFI